MYKEDVVHVHNGLFVTENNEIMPCEATRMTLEIVILSEINQTENDEYHRISLIYGN